MSSRLNIYRARNSRGFTLLELMIVISMVLILVSIAVPNYTRSIKQARESVLRQNLFTLRDLISQYTLDKQKAPQSLDDLIQAGYLKQLPRDPMTSGTDWQVLLYTAGRAMLWVVVFTAILSMYEYFIGFYRSVIEREHRKAVTAKDLKAKQAGAALEP